MKKNRIMSGGKTVYGASVGFLILENKYPRIPGDPVSAATWPFPVLYRVVKGSSAKQVVEKRGEGLLDAFMDAARDLVDQGVDGIATSGGFLVLFQRELSSTCPVPVATSSLLQIPIVQRTLPPGKRVGVITVNADELSADHMLIAGAPADTPIVGTERGSEFNRTMYGYKDGIGVDFALCEQDVLDAGKRLMARHPDVGAIVIECSRMPPYSRALRDAFGVPVFDNYSFVTWFQAGLQPRDFGHPGS